MSCTPTLTSSCTGFSDYCELYKAHFKHAQYDVLLYSCKRRTPTLGAILNPCRKCLYLPSHNFSLNLSKLFLCLNLTSLSSKFCQFLRQIYFNFTCIFQVFFPRKTWQIHHANSGVHLEIPSVWEGVDKKHILLISYVKKKKKRRY